MSKLVSWLTENGFLKVSSFLCNRFIGHSPIWFNPGGLEPDMTCEHCSSKDLQ